MANTQGSFADGVATAVTLALKEHREHVRVTLEAELGGRWNVECIRDALDPQYVILRYRQWVATHQCHDPIVVRFPRDWWEALKARWAPAWFLRRYPVRETVHTISTDAIYSTVSLPPNLTFPYVQIVTWDRDGRDLLQPD